MKKWKYLKGDESDFVGAPEWATMLITGAEFVGKWFLESFEEGSQRHQRNDSSVVFGDLQHRVLEYEIISQRQPIEDEEQDLNDCIGSTEALIAERGSRYGKFKDGADIMQSLKDVMREVDGWNNLTPSQKEALDMIQHKVGRILNGDPNYDDSWKDIAGYATLIASELNGEAK